MKEPIVAGAMMGFYMWEVSICILLYKSTLVVKYFNQESEHSGCSLKDYSNKRENRPESAECRIGDNE